MKIIVGLGNIGDKYLKNRHNAGFMVLDKFSDILIKEGIEIKGKEESKLKAITAKITYKDKDLLLVKPTTLMNLSGQAISKILSFYKETPENLIVIYDDIDLPLGEIRIRDKGSAGTHNGMKSVIEELGNSDFTRIRIGIESRGMHASEHQDLASFVLSDFSKQEQEDLEKILEQAAKITIENL